MNDDAALEEFSDNLAEQVDDFISDLSLEDALEAVEEIEVVISARAAGLRDDIKRRDA